MRSLIRVTAFVDWNTQIRNVDPDEAQRPHVRAGRALSRTARVIVRVLAGRDPSARFSVGLRFYHGWYKGFEPTGNRRAMAAVVAETDFSDLSRNPNVSISQDVRYGDDLLAALPARRHVRPAIHLPATLRRQDRNSPFMEKMAGFAGGAYYPGRPPLVSADLPLADGAYAGLFRVTSFRLADLAPGAVLSFVVGAGGRGGGHGGDGGDGRDAGSDPDDGPLPAPALSGTAADGAPGKALILPL